MAVGVKALKIMIKTGLLNLAAQSNKLSTGLQNAAPPSEEGPGKTILYLSEIGIQIEEIGRSIEVDE